MLGLIATPVLVVNAASLTVFAWIVDRWGWGPGRVSLLVGCSAAWVAMELMSRWYERQRTAGAKVARPAEPIRRRRSPSSSNCERELYQSSGVSAFKCVRPLLPISAQMPTGDITKGTPTAIY